MGPLTLITTTISEATAGHKAEFWPGTLPPNPLCHANSRTGPRPLLTDRYLPINVSRLGRLKKGTISRWVNFVGFSFAKFRYNGGVLGPAQPRI